LGPLGFSRDANGNYLQNGKIVKSVKVGGRSFDMFEILNENYAKSADLDTSFMI
jgi:hypothetical protein